MDRKHGLVFQDLDSRPAPLDSAFRRPSIAEFFGSDEDGGAGAGFRLGLSPRAAPSCAPVGAEPARPALMRRTSSVKITKQSLATILSDEEQHVLKKAMEKLHTVEGDFIIDVDANFLEPDQTPHMEAPAEKAKEPDLGAASTAAAISRLRSERSVRLEAEAPATQPGSGISRSMSRGPPDAQTFSGHYAQPSFRDDAGQADPRALELSPEAPRSQPSPAPLVSCLSASREGASSPATSTRAPPKRLGARPNELEPRAPNLELTPAVTPAPKPARVKVEPPADGANKCGAPFGANLKRPQGTPRRQLTGLGRASSATRLTSEPGSSDVAAQAAGDSQGKLVQFL